ncbi:hypothetical protein ACE6H2_004653 [Prunus campanulata]
MGYAKNGLCQEKLMYRMRIEGFEVDDYILATVLTASTPEHEQQMEAVENKIEERKILLKEHDGRLSYLQSNGFQLGNFYLVFQGVILTAIASGDSVFRCLDRSLLISVSALATLPNLVAFYLIGEEYIKILTQ